jgi:hypothetical protein
LPAIHLFNFGIRTVCNCFLGDLLVDLKDYIFTTEAHLLPLHLARKNVTFFPPQHLDVHTSLEEPILSCPSSNMVVQFSSIWEDVNELSHAEDSRERSVPQCTFPPDVLQSLSSQRFQHRSVLASEINWDNPEHVSGLRLLLYEELLVPVVILTIFICCQVN